MKILAFSGLRLGATFPEWPERGTDIRAALRAQLESIMARAAADECVAVISCGDLFASNSVPVEEVEAVKQICRKLPSIRLAVLPGGLDPWGSYSVYRHLQSDSPENLILLRPGITEPRRVADRVFLYGLAVDAGVSTRSGLSALKRGTEEGIHVACAYGDLGRLQPGPEEGLVMISPEITNHNFDLLIMADGGAGEQVGSAQKPVWYLAPAGPFCPAEQGGGQILKVTFDAGGARAEQIAACALHEQEIKVDVTGFADLASLAQAIRRKIAGATLVHVTLTGTRPAERTILEPTLHSLCAPGVLALRITDQTQLAPPEIPGERDRALALLWERFRQAAPDVQQEWLDALKLHAAGIQDPARWKEAPWVRS